MSRQSRPLPPLEVLKSLFSYDPETGLVTRRISRGQDTAGSVVGCLDHEGYRRIGVNGKDYRAHRIAWFLVTGKDPGELEVDHINGNRDDNSFRNLRAIPKIDNLKNVGVRKTNKAGLKNLHQRKSGQWVIQVKSQNGEDFRDTSDDMAEAAGKAVLARMRLHGKFARHR